MQNWGPNHNHGRDLVLRKMIPPAAYVGRNQEHQIVRSKIRMLPNASDKSRFQAKHILILLKRSHGLFDEKLYIPIIAFRKPQGTYYV